MEGPFLPNDKKEALAKGFTKIASEITNIPQEAFVIFIKENPYENMAQGGMLISEKNELPPPQSSGVSKGDY